TYGDYELVEFLFLKLNLGMFYLKSAQTGSLNTVNRRATALLGCRKIYGDIVLFAKNDNSYLDVDPSLFRKLYAIARNPLSYREIPEGTDKNEHMLGNLKIVHNANYFISTYFAKCLKECAHCHGPLTQTMVCSGCYRLLYDSEACQRAHWSVHKADCLTGPVNTQGDSVNNSK